VSVERLNLIVQWEKIEGQVPTPYSVYEAILNFHKIQKNSDFNLFKQFDYRNLERIIGVLEQDNVLKKGSVSLDEIVPIVNKHQVVCHGDAHINNFIEKDGAVYFIDASFCNIASHFYDFAKLFYLDKKNHQIILHDYYERHFKQIDTFSFAEINYYSELLLRSCIDYYGVFVEGEKNSMDSQKKHTELIAHYCREYNSHSKQ
ncbi:MAG: hypothetical protein AABX39_01155, partial [Nanoarchaeota archaeon]